MIHNANIVVELNKKLCFVPKLRLKLLESIIKDSDSIFFGDSLVTVKPQSVTFHLSNLTSHHR